MDIKERFLIMQYGIATMILGVVTVVTFGYYIPHNLQVFFAKNIAVYRYKKSIGETK